MGDVDGCADCSRDADIVQRTRSGNTGYCKRHALAHEYLQRTRGPVRNDEQAERIRQLGRALAVATTHPDKNVLDVVHVGHTAGLRELLRKLESDRVYMPGEQYDGTKQGRLP